MPGVELVFTTTVDVTNGTGSVLGVSKSTCSGTTLTPSTPVDTAGWPMRYDGSAGQYTVETRAPYSQLFPGGVMPDRMRLGFVARSSDTNVQSILSVPGTANPIVYPPATFRRAIGNGAIHITPDGRLQDWAKIAPFMSGLAASGNSSLLINTLFLYGDGANLFFAFDGTIGYRPPHAEDDSFATVQGQPLNVGPTGVLANDTPAGILSVVLPEPPGFLPSHGNLSLNADGSFTYTPTNPLYTGTDSFQYQATDNKASSNIANVTININPDSPPFVTAGGVLNYTENQPPQIVDGNVVITDPDVNQNMVGATVQITGNYQNGQDVLSFTNTPQISGSFNAATGTLTLTGTTTLANYQAALRSVRYSNTSENPSTLSRTVSWTVTDGILTSNTATSTINVTAVNDAPVLTAGATLAYTENQAATAIDTTITVSDVDSTNLQSATGQITGNYQSGADVLSFTNTPQITGSFNAATGTLTLTGNDTLANWQAALRTVRYNNTSENPSTATRTVTWIATDNGGASSAPVSSSITVTAVNDAPVLTAGGTLSYSENQAATAIDTTITVTDVDSANLVGATVQITGNYQNGQDVLSFTNTATITGSFNAATGTLTLTGSDTLANWQTALRNVKYNNTSDNPNTAARAVSWQVNDGGAVANLSNIATSTINVTAVNDAPVLTAGGSLSYTENGAPAAIDTTITVSDVDSTTLASATVQITGNYQNGADVLSFVNTPNITGSFNAATGTLTLTGTDTLANWQTALRSVMFSNTSDNPSTATRTITWQVSDGAGVNPLSNTATSTVTITPVNDAPVLTAGGTLSYTENDPATAIDTTITVTDVDSATLIGATAQITGNYVNGEDVLSFTNTPNISGSFNAATGTLTLTGTDTLANYQAALRAVKYSNTSENPSAAARTVSWQVNDGGAVANLSNIATSTINVTPTNDAPVLTAGATLSYTENQPATAIDTTITVSDIDSTTLASATVQITGNYVTGEDVLAFVNTPNITGSFNAGTGTLTLTGVDTLANYQAALRSVTYVNTSNNPSIAPRTVTWIGNDGGLNSAPVTSTINITPVNDAPVLTAGGTLSYTENQAPTAIDTTVTVSDVDSTTLVGATVQITGNYVNGEDVLSFVNTPNITGSFNAATGTLTLSGTDTLANYQTALRNVLYNNTSDNPSSAARTVTWQVNDGGAVANLSNTPTSTINVTPVNDAPVVTAGATLSYTENDPATVIDNTVTVTDVDSTTLASATIQITGNYASGQDVLSFVNTPNITGSFNAGTGTLTLTGADTLANYQAALRSVKYNNTSDNPSVAARTVSWTVNDGSTNSNTATSTINITPVNDAPVLTAGGTLSYTENQAATAVDTTITVSDIDSTTLVGATAQITGNYVNGEDVLSFVNTPNITGSFNAATGTLTLSGTDTLANYQTALRNVLYNNTSDNPSSAARTVTWQVNDGGAVANLSNTPTSTINVTPVNDAPVVTAGATLSYTENQAATAIDTTVTVTDVDSTTLASATVQITGNYASGQDVLSFVNTPNITGSFNAGTGTLTLTGVDTLANYQTALRSVKYANTSDNPSTASRTVTWIVNDGSTNSAGATSTITITPVNDAPVITAGGSLSYTENQAATAIDTTITVSDVDSATITGATAQITGNYVNGEDILSFTNTPNITGSFNAATGTLTLSGTDTVANYQTALRNVKYNNTSDNPTFVAKTVSWQVTDGALPSNVATSSITILPVNDAPTVTPSSNLTFTEGQGATVLDGGVTVTDPDSTTIASATVQITGNYASGQDVLAFVNTPNITGSFNAGTGTLTLTGSDTLANYQAALRTVTYNNTSTSPSVLTRTVTWNATDSGAATGAGLTSTISVISVNTAPTITAGATLNYTENQAATAIDTTITVSDPDTPNMAGATVQITGNYASGQDVLGFVNTPNITGSFNAGTGTLTLSGTDTIANYQAALRSVTYVNTSENPSSAARTVSWQVNDGDPSNNLSNVATSTINVTPVNDAPVLTAGSTVGYTENAAPVTLESGLTVTDPDNTTLTGATVSITTNFNAAQDVLAGTGNGTITVSYNAGTGVLTLSGTDTLANYQTVLRSVTYANTSESPSPATRMITWLATDGAATSTAVFTTVNITSVNDAPVITAGATLNYSENDPATVIDNTITVSDADNANLASATVQITGNYVNGQDVLSFTNTPQITGVFTPATGTLTLTGSDTVANYQAALRSVKYTNTSDNPSTAARTVSWTVNDGAANSNTATSTINVTAVNDAPVVTAGNTLSYTENQAATAASPALTVTDADSATLASATVQITTNYVNGQDVLGFVNTPNITGSFNAATGTLTLTGADTVANYQTALRSVTYVNTSENPSAAPRTLTWIANDGTSSSAGATSTINVTPVNDAPVITAGGTLNYTEADPATPIDTTLTVTDPDSATLASATVQITGNYANGQDILSFTNTPQITGVFTAATGTLTLTGVDTVANYQTALRAVKYNNTSVNPSTAARTVSWTVNDGSTNSNTATSTINVTSVNSVPVITAGNTLAYTENQAPASTSPALTLTDPDSTQIQSASVQITANYVNGQDVLAFTNTPNITGTWNAATGTMSLSGVDTVANYQAALRSITYQNTSDTPSTATRTLTWLATDNEGGASLTSAPVTSSITVTAVNDAPVVTAGATLNYTENDPATVIDNTITVSDVDSTTLVGATVSITANFASGQDVLSFTTLGPISGSYNAGTGVLTLTGTDTLANYQAALRTVQYSNSSDNPSTANRTISWVVNDGGAVNNLSAAVTSTVTVTAVNDAPVLANTSTLNYTENDVPTAINTAITVTDVDSTNLTGATVTFTAGYQNGQDVLSYTTALGITGTFNAGTGVLTLSGTTTVANYQTALRNVKYNNTSDDPITTARTVQFQVNDGGAVNNLSNTINSTINVTAVNDPPTAQAYAGLPAQAGIAITYPAGKLFGTDLEAGTTITIDTTPINLTNIGSITINANGSFTITPLPGSAGGTASFQYRVSDNGNPGPGVSGPYATVSFSVAGPAIYFVKNPAVGLANCTLGNECLVATAAGQMTAVNNSYIFLGDANTHTLAAALTLPSGGSVIGQGLTGFASFDAFFGIGAPAQGTLAARPSIGQPLPTLAGGTVTLNNSSQLRGFNMTAPNNSSAIVGVSRTGLAIDLNTITTNTPGAATTYAVDLTGPSSGTKFNFGAITANGGGANANGVRFNATSTTTVTFSTINTTLGAAFSSNSTGATNFTFGNINSTTGAAVSVSNSTGNFTFANVTSTTGAAVTTNTTGGGTFQFTAVSSTTGRAVDVNTATGSFTFTSIAANGSATGILVQNVTTGTGSFTVNGTGSTAGSGGTIQNCTAKGGDFRNVNNLTLKNMNFTNNATVNLSAATTCGDIVSGSNNGPANCNANIALSGGSANILIQNVSATGSKQIGIDGNTISNLTLNGVTVTGNGNEVGEDGVQLYNPTGTLSITNTSLFRDNAANQFEVGMSTGTLNSTFTGSTFSITNFPSTAGGVAPSPGNATANAGLLFHANSGSNATMNATVSGCTFARIYSYALRWDAANGTSTGTINFGQTGSGNTFTDNGLAIGISSTGNGAIIYNIKDNTATNNTAVTSTFATSVISTSFTANATRTGVVDNNTVGVNGGAAASGCFVAGCAGLELTDSGAQGTQNLTVTNNKTFHTNGSGILVTSSSASTETLRVKIANNQVAQPDGTTANPGIMVQDGNSSPNGVTATCVDISANQVQGLWASGTTHKSAIRILGTRAIQFSLTNFNTGTEYAAGAVTAGCTTQCTGTVGTDGNAADFLSQQNPLTITAQTSSGGTSASQNRTAASAVWSGAAGTCP